jgi:hypothetical protein
MMCHKFCMTSVTISCSEYIQLKRGMKWYFMATDESDRSRWVTGLDCVRNSIKDDERKSPGGADIDSILGGIGD